MNSPQRLPAIERVDPERAVVVDVAERVTHELDVVDKTAVVVRLALPPDTDTNPVPADASVVYVGPDGDLRVGSVAYRQDGMMMIQSAPRLDPNRH